jgi:hypothetical protein
MAYSYEEWMSKVRAAFDSMNTPMADWQLIGAFDYQREFNAGVKPNDAAMKANRHWWHEWNKSLKQDCRQSKDCWLPHGHQGHCEHIAESAPGR